MRKGEEEYGVKWQMTSVSGGWMGAISLPALLRLGRVGKGEEEE